MLQQKGEQIFEDDGHCQMATGNALYEVPCKFPADIYEDKIEFENSFEVFQGKLFYNSKLQSLGGAEYGINSLSSRVARLLEEYTLIKAEIDSRVNESRTNDSTIWSTLQNTAKSHIDDLEHHKIQEVFKSKTEPMSDLHHRINSISQTDEKNDVSKPFVQSKSLHENKSTMDTIEMIKLDNRISAIESVIGPTSSLISGVPLTKTLSKLEAQLSSINTIDDLQQKISILKNEVGIFCSNSSSKSQRELKLIEAVMAIKAINNKLNQLNCSNNDLPVIASRLKMLDGVHRASLGYLSRLHYIETLTEKISKSMSINEQVLRSLKSVSVT